jgi:hypothetical protein
MDRRTSAVLSGIFAGHSVPQRPQLWGQLASIPGSSALTHPLQGHSIDDPGRDHRANRLVHEQHRQQHREEPPTPLRHGKHSVRYVSGSCPFGTQPTRTRSLLHGAVPPTDRLACVRAGSRSAVWAPQGGDGQMQVPRTQHVSGCRECGAGSVLGTPVAATGRATKKENHHDDSADGPRGRRRRRP